MAGIMAPSKYENHYIINVLSDRLVSNGWACMLVGIDCNSNMPLHLGELYSSNCITFLLFFPHDGTIFVILLVQSIPFPSKPAEQLHSKLPKVLLQVAFAWQLSIPFLHSSISTRNRHARQTICITQKRMIIKFISSHTWSILSYQNCYEITLQNKAFCSPVHENPLPLNPVLHIQS